MPRVAGRTRQRLPRAQAFGAVPADVMRRGAC